MASVVARRFDELARQMSASVGRAVRPEASRRRARLQIAVGSMANAVKRISVARGYDVTRYTLQCFGGAGGQHACRLRTRSECSTSSATHSPVC